MNETIAETIVKDGIETLIEDFGVVKTIKFFQLMGICKGDSVKEIESKTEKMSMEEALAFIEKVKNERKDLWERMGLVKKNK